jgi:hypothetical protein
MVEENIADTNARLHEEVVLGWADVLFAVETCGWLYQHIQLS